MNSSVEKQPFKKTSFGKYELVEQIGTGGMAEVYRARSYGAEGLYKTLVIKRILAEFAQNRNFIEMFISEAKIAVQLNHPNIVQIYDFGKVDDDFYLAMEFVDGLDLSEVIDLCARTDSSLSIGEAVYIVSEVAKGLHYAHNRLDEYGRELTIVHRDISPQNILISVDGTVKIVDFGIAKATSQASEEPNILKGKFSYMSPEQASAEPVDVRSDLFSLGAVLFELICGRRLFRGADSQETMSLVKSAVVPDIRTLNPAVPEALEHLLYKVLAVERAERPASARDFQVELTRVLYSLGEIHDALTLSGHVAKMLEAAPAGGARAGAPSHTAVTDVITGSTPARTSLAHSARAGLAMQSTPIDELFLRSSARKDASSDRTEISTVTRELKEVVVLVGEVVGMAELSAELSAEIASAARWEQLLLDYQRIVESIAFKNGALVGHCNAHDFAIVLGVPVSSENDAQRAVRIAMDLHEAIAGLSLSLDSAVQLAIGVSVGEAFVERNTKQAAAYKWSFYADSQARATRLSQAAMARETLIGQQVFRRVLRKYECVAVDALHVDAPAGATGHGAQPVPAYRLVGQKSQAAQIKELRTSYRAFYGREVSLGVLRDTYRESRTRDRAMGVLITGEQGIGKSTLVEEFLSGLAARDVEIVRGVIAPIERDVALGAMANMLLNMLQLGARDDLRQLRETLQVRIDAFFPEDDATERALMLHSLGAILNLRFADSAFLALDGEERRARKYLSLMRLWTRYARRKPVVLAIDDVHNLDESTLEFTAEFLNARHDVPTYLVFTADVSQVNPQSAAWKAFCGARYMHCEELTELGAAPARELIKSLLGVHGEFDERLVEEVHRRAGGNPLFIKEVIDVLQGRNLINDAQAVNRLQASDEDPQWLPASVEGLIGARIDRLELGTKIVLQQVSLLGAPFSVQQAELVAEHDAQETLDALVELQLLERADTRPRATTDSYDPAATPAEERLYRFCNALTREVASRSLVPAQARMLHLRIAEHLIARRASGQEAAQIGADNAMIAGHFASANETERAVYYYRLAAENALNHRGAAACLRLCNKIIALSQDDAAETLQILLLRERALTELGEVEVRQQALRDLHERVMRRGTRAQQVDVLLREARCYFDAGDVTRARKSLESARHVEVSAAQTQQTLAESYLIEIPILMSEGNRERGHQLVDEAIAIFAGHTDHEALSRLAHCYNLRGVMLRQAGRQSEAFEAYEKALEYAEAGDFGKQQRLLLINTGVALAHAGKFSEALVRYERALEQCRRLGHRNDEASVLVNQGDAYLHMGRVEEAVPTIRRAIYLAEKAGMSGTLADGQTSLGRCYLEIGALDKAEKAATEGLRIADSIPNVYLSILATLTLAEVQLERVRLGGDAQGAQTALLWAQDALERSENAAMQWGIAGANSVMARALAHLGEREESLQKSSAAVARLTGAPSYGDDGILYTHAQLLRGVAGREAQRRDVLRRAYEHVILVRDEFPDAAGRELFMARALNRQIVEAAADLLDIAPA